MEKIDIISLLKLALRNLVLLICVAVVSGSGAILYCRYVADHKYSATGSILVTNGGIIAESYDQNGQKVDGGDISASIRLIDTVISVLNKPGIYHKLAERIPDYTYAQLASMANVESEKENSMFISVTFTTDSIEESIKIVNEFLALTPEYINEFIPNSKTAVSNAESGKKVSPNTAAIVMGAVAICDLVVYLIILIRFTINKVIRGEDDFKQHFDIPVLAVIPSFDNPKAGRYPYYKKKGGYYGGY